MDSCGTTARGTGDGAPWAGATAEKAKGTGTAGAWQGTIAGDIAECGEE